MKSKLDNHPWLRRSGKASQGSAWQASVASAILFLGFSLTDGAPLFFTSGFCGLAMFWAILSYERKHYYRIIMELESELENLTIQEIG